MKLPSLVLVALLATACNTSSAGPPDAASPPAAEAGAAPSLETRFTFSVTPVVQGAEAFTYNENQRTFLPVALPDDLGWSCHRISTVVADDRLRSGFECSSDNWKTFSAVLVGCKRAEVDPMHTSAMRIFAPSTFRNPTTGMPKPCSQPSCIPKSYDLVASCETVSLKSNGNPYR